MKVPTHYKGSLVAIQLARPVYVFNYAAHLKWTATSNQQPVLQHAEAISDGYSEQDIKALVGAGRASEIEREKVLRDVFPGVLLVEVSDDSVTFAMPVPSNLPGKVHLVHKTVGFADVVSVDRLAAEDFQVDGARAEQRDMPSRIVSP